MMDDVINLTAKAIILDIEGTTTDINFVKNILFPYSKQMVLPFLRRNWSDPIIKESVKEILEHRNKLDDASHNCIPGIERENGEVTVESVSKIIEYFIDCDYKIYGLKNIQGVIWEEGFKQNCFKGHIFDDVPGCLKKWYAAGINIYIYSSGSVKAQKLLFQHNVHGDLNVYIKDNFDSSIGPKTQKESYEKILHIIKMKGDETVFLTDIPAEAEASENAHIKPVLMERPGNKPLEDQYKLKYPVAKSFNQLNITKN